MKLQRILRNTWFGVLIVLMVVTGGCSGAQNRTDSSATPTPLPTSVVPPNPTYKVQRGDVSSQLQFTGRVAPNREESLFFRTSGRVRKLYIKRDDQVKQGQVLADLEIDDLERQLEIMQLDIRAAGIRLEMVKLRLDQAKKQPQTTAQKVEVAMLEYEVQLAEIDLQRVSLDEEDLKAAIASAQLIASFDGTVLSVGISEGSNVEAYRPVVVVGDLSQVELVSEVSSNDMQYLKEGMPVSALLVGRPGEVYTGIIRQLPYPYGGGGGANVEDRDKLTRITIDGLNLNTMELGDLMRVTVTLEKREGVLWLPPQAIRTFEGRKFVLVQEGEIERRVDVKVGLTSDERVEILEGVEEGQVVVGP